MCYKYRQDSLPVGITRRAHRTQGRCLCLYALWVLRGVLAGDVPALAGGIYLFVTQANFSEVPVYLSL